MRILPALTEAIFILAQHTSGNDIDISIDHCPPGDDTGRFAAVIITGIYPAGGVQDSRSERPGRMRMGIDPIGAGAQYFSG